MVLPITVAFETDTVGGMTPGAMVTEGTSDGVTPVAGAFVTGGVSSAVGALGGEGVIAGAGVFEAGGVVAPAGLSAGGCRLPSAEGPISDHSLIC